MTLLRVFYSIRTFAIGSITFLHGLLVDSISNELTSSRDRLRDVNCTIRIILLCIFLSLINQLILFNFPRSYRRDRKLNPRERLFCTKHESAVIIAENNRDKLSRTPCEASSCVVQRAAAFRTFLVTHVNIGSFNLSSKSQRTFELVHFLRSDGMRHLFAVYGTNKYLTSPCTWCNRETPATAQRQAGALRCKFICIIG